MPARTVFVMLLIALPAAVNTDACQQDHEAASQVDDEWDQRLKDPQEQRIRSPQRHVRRRLLPCISFPH